MNQIGRLENEARDSIVAVLADLSVRKLSAFVWYSRSDKKQALRALAAAVSFLDSAVLASVAVDENADIKQEFLRMKNFVINSSPEFENISSEIDNLSHIAHYISHSNTGREGRAESLLEYWR